MIPRLNFDQIVASVLLVPVLLVLTFLYVIAVLVQGRPFLYASERMKTPTDAFQLYKIRTMTVAPPKEIERVLGGDQVHRVTRLGAFLRRTRLDELPQIFNVLRGDIGFIGPRPPLRRHVTACPDLFSVVLSQMRPGITGLATVMVHDREEKLLSACRTAEESERVYLSRCLPLKARFDLIYHRRSGFRLNMVILWLTVARLKPWTSSGKRWDKTRRDLSIASMARNSQQPA